MTLTHLRCSFTLLFSFAMLVLPDSNTSPNNSSDPFLESANRSLIFLSEIPLLGVRIFGRNLDAQKNISLFNSPCSCFIRVNVLSFSSNEMNVSLSATPETQPGIYLFIVSTSMEVVKSDVRVEILRDPEVSDVRPKQVFSVGGIRLTVHGSGFNGGGKARIEVVNATKVPNESVTSKECSSRTDSTMTCVLPRLDVDDASLRGDQSLQQIIGTYLAFENKLLPLPIHQLFNFTTERPSFASTSGLFIHDPNKHSLLDISGSQILVGCSREDYTVKLGSYECPVTEATDNLLTFEPPKSKPSLSGDIGNRFNCRQYRDALPLLVELGDPSNSSLTFFVRCLRYESSDDLAFQLGVGLGVGLFLLILLAIVVALLVHLCYRYSKQKMKDMAWEHNIKVVQEFVEQKEKMENMVCIPAILQMTSNIHEKNETAQFEIFQKRPSGGGEDEHVEDKSNATTTRQHEVTTTAVVTQTTPSMTRDDVEGEGQPSTSYEEFSNFDLNSHEEISQNLLCSDCVPGKADAGRNSSRQRIDE